MTTRVDRNELDRLLRILLTGSAFVLFWGGGTLVTWVLVPAAGLPTIAPARRLRLCRAVVKRCFVLFHDYMRVLGLIDFDPRSKELKLDSGPCVVVANHPTLVDVTAIMSRLGELACVVKGDVFASPMVGRLLRNCRHIDGGEGDPMSGAAVVQQALDRLESGQAVLLFPEGTRSPEKGLWPFHRGAFEIACRAGVPILPLLVTCDPQTLMKHQRWYDVPTRTARLEVTALEPIPVERFDRDPRRLARHVEALYKERLGIREGCEGGGEKAVRPGGSEARNRRARDERPGARD